MEYLRYMILALAVVALQGCSDDDHVARPLSDAEAASLAQSYTEQLASGKRTKGTTGESDAADFIIAELSAEGFTPTEQYFDAVDGTVVADPASATVLSKNIIVEVAGKKDSDKFIILGAHYDSVPQTASTGYTDNASGTGIGMAVAIALRRISIPYTVRVIFFGAEESCPTADCPDPALAGTGGVKGSTAYASTLTTTDVNNIVAMVNLDTATGGDFIYAHGGSIGRDGWVRDRLLAIANELGIDVEINPGNVIPYADEILYPQGTTGSWSDHFPFLSRGAEIGYIEATNWQIADLDGYEQVEELFLTTGNGAIWHTNRDTKAFMDDNLPGRVEQQNEDVVAMMLEFMRSPQPPEGLTPGALARREASICAEVVGKKVASTANEAVMRDYIAGRLTEMGYTADIHTFTYNSGADTSHNVFAVKAGVNADEIVVGAHYDSVSQNDGNGYTDNCSGAATVLALAESLQSEVLPYTLRFILFGAEENGLNGSKEYVAAMDGATNGDGGQSLGDIANVKGMLNLDTAWGGDFVYVHGASQGNAGWMREQLIAVAKGFRYTFRANPGNFISVAYWKGAGPSDVPQDTECVTGATYAAADTTAGLSPLTPDDFMPADLVDTSAGTTTVQDVDYCVFLPAGTTGTWSDHGPFQGAGKEIAYIESTNFDIPDFDGYQQVQSLQQECLDAGDTIADCTANGSGEIWHTDRDKFEYLFDTFPGKIHQQSTQVMDTALTFLRDPQVPLIASVPPSLASVEARSSDVRERIAVFDDARILLRERLATLEVSNTGIEALVAAIRSRNIEDSALFRRLTPEAQERLREIKQEFQGRFPEEP